MIFEVFVGGLAALATNKWIEGYFDKKGNNRADIEDVQELTRLRKDIELGFTRIEKGIDHKNSLRTLVASERMAAHQKAFSLIHDLLTSSIEYESNKVACDQFWKEKCLYLTPEARKSFQLATNYAGHRHYLKGEAESYDTGDRILFDIQKESNEYWRKILACLDPIIAGVELPSFASDEIVKPADSDMSEQK